MWIVKIAKSSFLQVRFPDPGGSGRIIQVSTKTVSEREARLRAQEIVARYTADAARKRSGGDVTTQHVAAEYYDTELSRRKWARAAFIYLNRIVDHLGEERRYCDVTIADVAAFVDTLDGTVSDTTINRALAIWRRMHNHATKIRGYPAQRIEWGQLFRTEPEGRTRHLTPDELATLLERLPEDAQAIVIFAVLTGARKSQVLGLTWDRVDVEHATVTIFRKSQKKQAKLTLDLHPTALAILERQRELRGSEPTVFDTTNFRKIWEKALVDAGVTDFRFHDLRHTFATWLARKASLALVQKLLGHSHITTTMRYAHVQRDDMRTSIRELPAIEIVPTTNRNRVPVRLGVTPPPKRRTRRLVSD